MSIFQEPNTVSDTQRMFNKHCLINENKPLQANIPKIKWQSAHQSRVLSHPTSQETEQIHRGKKLTDNQDNQP